MYQDTCTYDIESVMFGAILMGAFILKLFSKFAKRDSDFWDKSYESKEEKTTRIVLMCIWALYALIPLMGLVFELDYIDDENKPSNASRIMLGISLFYYQLTFRKSPREYSVRLRKIIAYLLISILYVRVWPTTFNQLITGQIPGVYGDAWGTILSINALIYGISILIIWLLLKHYKSDKLISYSHNNTKEVPPVIEVTPNNSEMCEKHSVVNQEEATILEQDTPSTEEMHVEDDDKNTQIIIDNPQTPNNNNLIEMPPQPLKDESRKTFLGRPPKRVLWGTSVEKTTYKVGGIIQFLKRAWKWIVGIIIIAALIIVGVTLYNYLHDEYLPKKKLDGAVNEIIQKFETDNTKVEYAHYILQKDHDWGFGTISCNNSNGNQYIDSKLLDFREDAFKVIENLAYQGDAQSQFDLGDMYYHGDEYTIFMGNPYTEVRNGLEYNIKCDKEKAAYWWQESAQNGYIRAYVKIGVCYKDGIGVNKDMKKAIDWLKKGAEAGEPWAQKIYGDLFLNGVTVYVGSHYESRPYFDQTGHRVFGWEEEYEVSDYKTLIKADVEQAKYWWRKSAAQGNERAKEQLQKIY